MDDAKAVTREVVSRASSEPEAQNAKRSTPVPEPAQQSTPNALAVKKKVEKKSKPVVARQQGRLF